MNEEMYNEENTGSTNQKEPILTGRPDRVKVISEDEILNLHISLNTMDADEFINSL